ncbi:hypothetical protein PG995_000313 [Apiospora arundinis]
MTSRAIDLYGFRGLYLPWGPADHVPIYTTRDETLRVKQKGFAMVKTLDRIPIHSLVQSLEDGQLYINKICLTNGGNMTQFNKPPEFRISSYVPTPYNGAPGLWLRPDYILPDEPYFQKIGKGTNRHQPVAAPTLRGLDHGEKSIIETSYPQRPENVFIHYENRGPGGTPQAGHLKNAFPTIRLANWEESALEEEVRPTVSEGKFGLHPNEWEDVFGLGFILRCLAMTHVPFWHPVNNPCPTPLMALNESGGW